MNATVAVSNVGEDGGAGVCSACGGVASGGVVTGRSGAVSSKSDESGGALCGAEGVLGDGVTGRGGCALVAVLNSAVIGGFQSGHADDTLRRIDSAIA